MGWRKIFAVVYFFRGLPAPSLYNSTTKFTFEAKKTVVQTDKAMNLRTDNKDPFRRYPTVMVLSIILVSSATSNYNYQLLTVAKIKEAGNEQL